MKQKKFLLYFLLIYIVLFFMLFRTHPYPHVRNNNRSYYTKTTYTRPYYSGKPEKDELEGVQCPIPMKDRVKNYTGTQCVFSSVETLARWAECKILLEPVPLTQRPGCRSYSSPYDIAKKLEKFGFEKYQPGKRGYMYEQTYGNREKGIQLIKKAMKDGRGALFGVPGHAMVMLHYDEEKNVFKWVDNSDWSLRVQTTTVTRFKRMWDSWVLVIYSVPDLFPEKARKVPQEKITTPNLLPIINRNGPNINFPPNYIPMPLSP